MSETVEVKSVYDGMLNNTLVRCALVSYTRDDLRALAKALNIPRGKTDDDTRHNLARHIGGTRATISVTLSFDPKTMPIVC